MTAAAEWPVPPVLERAGTEGIFGPDTLTWRINRENVLGVIGGGRALILQVGHPLVAAGVGDHSNYRKNPWDRLFRTLDAVTAIVFGSPEESQEAARAVWRRHGKVRGSAPDGRGYDARDPHLAMWVHATLVDSALLVYDRFVERLSLRERERYYEEQKLFAEMFGVPSDLQPETYADFRVYFDRTVQDELAATAVLLDVVDATLVRPEMPPPLRPLRPPVAAAYRLLTTGLLPARMRDLLGLSWGPGRDRLMNAAAPLARALLPVTPGVVREFPRAREATRRLAVHNRGR